jgi:transposase-like protein
MVRKKGKHLTPKDKEEVKRMYITGSSVTEIKNKFNMTSMNTFYRWKEAGEWDKLKQEFFDKVTSNELDIILKESLDNTGKALDDLSEIRTKAIGAIKDESVRPFKFSEASRSYIDAVDLERKIRIEGLQLSFLYEIAKILKQEIQDQALLFRIGERLREMWESSQKRSLTQIGNRETDE